MTPIDTDTSFDWVDDIFAPFSQQSDDKGITLTWSSKDSITKAKAAIIAKCKEREAAAKAVLLRDLADCGEIHHSVLDYRLEELAALSNSTESK